MRVQEGLIIGGALVIIPLGMGGIPLMKLLFFAFAVLTGATALALRHPASVGLCGTESHSLARQIRTVSVGAPCDPVPHCYALRVGSLAWGFLCTFFVVVFLSPLWSAAPFLSVVGVEPRFEGVMAYIVFFGLALTAGGMVRSGRGDSLLSVILWSNAGVVLYGLLQVLGLDPFDGWWEADVFLGRAFSTVGQPNMLGQFLLLTGPFAILTAWKQWGSGGAIMVLGGNLLVLLVTGSRAAIVGAMVGGGFLIFQVLGCHPERSRRVDRMQCRCDGSTTLTMTHRHLFMTLTFLIICIISLPLAFRRFSLPGEWDRSLHGRLAIWRDVVAMIRERPQGWGLETTGLLFPRFQSAPLTVYESLTTSVDRAHSKPLDLLLTVGPLGLLTYYAFLATLLFHCVRVWRRRGDVLALVGVISLVGTSVSLLFGFEGITVHAFFWLLCGMLVGRCMEGGHSERVMLSLSKHGTRAMAVLCIFLLVAIAFTILSLSSRITAHRAERAFQSGDFVAAVQGYDRAVRKVPWDRALLIRFLETALLARERADDVQNGNLLDAAFKNHLHYLDRLTSGHDPLLPSLEAWHVALQGEKEEALGFLDDAKRRAPFSVSRLRIAMTVARLLHDFPLGETLRVELLRLLPPWWNDMRDPRHRILLKENPWLGEFLLRDLLKGKLAIPRVTLSFGAFLTKYT